MLNTHPLSYSVLQKTLHWSMALLILFNLIFPSRLHAYIGLTVLGLFVVRLAARFMQDVPEPHAFEPAIARRAASLAHWAFYAMFALMPLSGVAKYYFGVAAAGKFHGGPLKILLWTLIVIHVLGVLVHQYYWKTDIIKRMTYGVQKN